MARRELWRDRKGGGHAEPILEEEQREQREEDEHGEGWVVVVEVAPKLGEGSGGPFVVDESADEDYE